MWLGTTHQNQILVLLQCNLLFKGSRIEVSGMTFLLPFVMHTTVVTVVSMKGVSILLGLEKLEKHWCQVLRTITNINGDHWVVTVLYTLPPIPIGVRVFRSES